MKKDTDTPALEKNTPPAARRSASTRSIGGRLWKIGMGCLLILIGSIFVQYMWNSYQRAAEMDVWREAPCQILSSEIAAIGLNQRGMPKYAFQVRFAFEHDGKTHTGTRIKRLPVESSDQKRLQAQQARLPAGASVPCFFPADNPELAVLKKDSKGALYSIWFPFLFIIGGSGLILSALLPSKKHRP